jgi:hypothetical protein
MTYEVFSRLSTKIVDLIGISDYIPDHRKSLASDVSAFPSHRSRKDALASVRRAHVG